MAGRWSSSAFSMSSTSSSLESKVMQSGAFDAAFARGVAFALAFPFPLIVHDGSTALPLPLSFAPPLT